MSAVLHPAFWWTVAALCVWLIMSADQVMHYFSTKEETLRQGFQCYHGDAITECVECRTTRGAEFDRAAKRRTEMHNRKFAKKLSRMKQWRRS